VAGLIAKTDSDRGFWWSPSNQNIHGIVGTTRAVDFALSDANARTNLLNEQNIATFPLNPQRLGDWIIEEAKHANWQEASLFAGNDSIQRRWPRHV
jgi:hypothetical protein